MNRWEPYKTRNILERVSELLREGCIIGNCATCSVATDASSGRFSSVSRHEVIIVVPRIDLALYFP